MLSNCYNKKQPIPVIVVLDNIRSALNVGAIFRTCDATNVEKLILGGITPYPPHNKIPKTALGSIESVNWVYTKNTMDFMEALPKTHKIVSIEIDSNSKDIYQYEFSFPTVIILGNEVTGVSREILDISDDIVHIPMFGMKESLNVATSAGIVLYEIIRQYYYTK